MIKGTISGQCTEILINTIISHTKYNQLLANITFDKTEKCGKYELILESTKDNKSVCGTFNKISVWEMARKISKDWEIMINGSKVE